MTSLSASLVRGAVTSPFRRAGKPDATLPTERLTLPAAPAAPGPLAAYRTICGFPEAGDRDGAGPGDAGPGVLPLTYPHVLAFPLAMRLMTGRGFPLPVVGLVHTWFEACGHRAVRADEWIQLTVYAEELNAHRRGTEVTMVTEARVDGELVWESRSGYLSRHATEAAAAGRREETDAEALPALREWRLPGDLGRRYGAVSGDRNPIHLHPLTARLFGFPGPSPTACGRWPAAWPRQRRRRSPTGPVTNSVWYEPTSRLPSCCPPPSSTPPTRAGTPSPCAARADAYTSRGR